MRPWLIGVAALAVAVGSIPWLSGLNPPRPVPEMPLAKVSPSVEEMPPLPPAIPPMTGLDLTHIALDDEGASAPATGHRVARLTIDPELQRTAMGVMRSHQLPQASIVMTDPATGNVLVYASRAESGPLRDGCAEATAPAASVFKIITGSALVQDAGLTPDTRECYSGGEHEISQLDLEENPQRDRWCVTLAGAMGRSVNTVFGRLAQQHLKPKALEDMAEAYGFGHSLPFDVAVQASTLKLPSDPLGYARTAAGFWNSTLSPLQAASISTTLARGGEAVRLTIVRDVREPGGAVIYTASPAAPLRRVVAKETAQAVTTMMEHTVSEGTSYRAFHDLAGASFLPGVTVAGKTGTLSEGDHLYTWFTGFAPSRTMPGVRPVTIAVLVVNHPTWKTKANVVAREMLRAYFFQQNVERVTRPSLGTVAKK
jgi:peptidoglycan glycosyltransferase